MPAARRRDVLRRRLSLEVHILLLELWPAREFRSPSRGEMTDAAMACRAECDMPNKGPSVGETIDVPDSLLLRLDELLFKQTPTMRALRSC